MSDQGGGGESGAIRSLFTHIGFSLDAHNAQVADSLFEKLVHNAHHLLEALALLEVGKELYHFAHAAAEAGTAALLAGEKFGITADDVQSLGFAAGQAGVSFEQVGHGLKFLQKNAYEASQGNKGAAKTFHDLGLKVTDSSGKVKPAIELFQEFADKIKDTQDPAKRTALSVLALGRSGSELIPLLREGGEGIREMMERAHLLGAVMDEETVEAAHRLHRSMLELNAGITGVKNRIGASLFPALQKATDGLVNWLMANRKLIDSGIQILGDAVTWLGDKVGKLADLMDHHRGYVLSLAIAFAALAVAQFASLVPMIAMTLGYLAFAAVIAAVWEEVYHFANGTNSLMGDVVKWFKEEGQKAETNWMVKILARMVELTDQVLKGVEKLIQAGALMAVMFPKLTGIAGAFGIDLTPKHQLKVAGLDYPVPHQSRKEFEAQQEGRTKALEEADYFNARFESPDHQSGADFNRRFESPGHQPITNHLNESMRRFIEMQGEDFSQDFEHHHPLGPTRAPQRDGSPAWLADGGVGPAVNVAGSTFEIHIDGSKSPEQTGAAVLKVLEDEQQRQQAAIDNATRNRINR